MACPPAALTRATVSRAASSIKSATARRAPSRAKARAVARPIPPPPPVISADFPSSNPAITSSLHGKFRLIENLEMGLGRPHLEAVDWHQILRTGGESSDAVDLRAQGDIAAGRADRG